MKDFHIPNLLKGSVFYEIKIERGLNSEKFTPSIIKHKVQSFNHQLGHSSSVYVTAPDGVSLMSMSISSFEKPTIWFSYDGQISASMLSMDPDVQDLANLIYEECVSRFNEAKDNLQGISRQFNEVVSDVAILEY